MNTIISHEAKKAIDVGRAEHWRFEVVEKQPEWIYEEVDETNIGLDRINALRAAGIGIRGFVVAHEAPRLLMAPKVKKAEKKDNFKNTPQIVPDMSGFFELLIIVVGVLFRLMLLDPALIVILDDENHTMLMVMKWYDLNAF